jgi:signal transduction histidine kinase
MKRFLLFLTLVFQAVFGFSQSENSETAFHQLIEQSLEFIDNRKLDSAETLLEKSALLIPKVSQDSTLYFKQQLADAALVMRRGDNQTALKVFLSALPYFEKQNDLKNQALTFYQLGICHYFLNRRSVSEDYFLKAYKLKEHLSPRIQTKILQNLGTINLEEGMSQKRKDLFEKAIENYEKASAIYLRENQITELSLCQSLLGEVYIQLEEYDKALEIIDNAIQYGEQAQSDDYIAFAYIKKSSALGKIEKYSAALKVVQKAIKTYQKTKDKNSLLYAYNQKKRYLDATAQYKASSQLADTIWNVTVQIYNERIANGIAEIETKYKTAEKEKEIAEQKIEIQNKNIFALILGGSIIILGIVLIGLYKRHQFKQKQFQKEMNLKDALAQIKTQNRLQEQRLEISRDLHDNIGAQLTFIISSIDNLKRVSKETSDTFKEKLTNISGFTAETIGQLRDTVWAMNKNEISFDDLYGRLLSYVEKVKKITDTTKITVDHSLTSSPDFTSVIGMNLFRVIQESINNALKHANASEIHIAFQANEKELFVEIQDNGKGFDTKQFIAGNGMSNMEERMSSINGHIEVDSQLNKGTRIILTVSI